jgi:hypothetical protein
MQSIRDLIKPTLLDDPFLLHTSLEENISNNVGNDVYRSIHGFMKYLPPEYSKLLTDSHQIISDLHGFRDSLINLKIDTLAHGYDEFNERIIELSYNTDVPESDNQQIINDRNLKHLVSVEDGEVMIIRSEDLNNSRSRSRYSDDSEFDSESDSDPGTNILIDHSVEETFNQRLDQIIDRIITKSLRTSIFVPVGYSHKSGGGHCIGLIVSPDHLTLCNGGSGIQYHHMDTRGTGS